MRKTCTKCGVEKGIEAFCKGSRYKDGLNPWCKGCRTEYNKGYYKVNKPTISERVRKFRAGHKEEYSERYRQWAENNKERIAIRMDDYRDANKDKLREYRKQYCKDNVNKIKQYWKSPNGKSVSRISAHKRRSQKAGVKAESFDPVEVLKRDGYICQNCGRKTRPDFNRWHSLYPNLDHIVPLSKGGNHTKQNTQCLCRQCNLYKGSTGKGDQLRLFG